GQAIRFTLIITAVAVPLQVALGLAIALLVNTRFRGHSVFLYLAALPIGISDLAAGMIWLSILTERGYLNAALQRLGLIAQPVVFLTLERPEWLLGAIILTELWRATAIVMVIVLAGLQLIPKDYAETAAVFGAGRWQTVRHVLLPLLPPSLQPALVISTWVAVPLLLIALAAFTPRSMLYAWPRPLWPRAFSLDTMLFFLRSTGVWSSTLNSVVVAVLTIGLAFIIAAPAGYALA